MPDPDEKCMRSDMDDKNKRRDKFEAGDANEQSPEHERSPSAMSSAESSKSEKTAPPTWKSYVFLVVVLGVYIALNYAGAHIFRAIERRKEHGTDHWFPEYKEKFVMNHSSSLNMADLEEFLEKVQEALDQDISSLLRNDSTYGDPWTISNGFLLSFTIASTIGYGTVIPVTPGGQAFCIIYALLSIPLTGLLAAKIGSLMAYFIKKAAAFIFQKKKHHHWAKIASILFTFFVGLLIYILIPSLILFLVDNDEEWRFIECLYCIFITLTTIGFGDYVPDPHAAGGMGANIFVLIWVVAGLAWFATIVNLIATSLTKQATSIKRKVAHQKINVKSIKSATATLGGHISGKKYRSKSSLDSAETGRSIKSNGKGSSRPPSSIHETDGEAEMGKFPVTRGDSQASKGSAKVAWTKGRESVASVDGSRSDTVDGPPAVSFTHLPDDRRESTVSRSSKRDDVLGPSGFLAVVINNMEDYGEPEPKDGDP